MPWTKYFSEGLTPEIIEKARKELGETETVRRESLEALRNLIKDTPDFYPCVDEAFLLRFLRVRKYDVKNAFDYLKSYYVIKAQYSGIFTDLLPSQIKNILDQGQAATLEHRLETGVGLFVIRIGQYEPEYISSEDVLAFMLIASEVALELETTQIAGYSVIIDFDGFDLRKAHHFGNPKAMYRIVMCILKSMPGRLKSYHFVNEPVYLRGLLNVVIHLVPRKIRERLHWHGSNLKSLHEFISPELLPEELGGQQGPLKKWAKEYGERVLSREEYFKEMIKYGYQGKTVEQLRR